MRYQTTISHAVNADGERVNIRTPGLRDGDLFCANAAAVRCG